MGSLLDEYLLYRTILADNIETLLRCADTTAVIPLFALLVMPDYSVSNATLLR